MSSEIALVKCEDYSSHLVQAKTRQALDLLGGIEKFIKPGSKVLINPNLLTTKEPETAIDTHPEVVRAVIRILKEINCCVYVGDSPSAFHAESTEVEEVWEKSGIKKIAEEEDVQLVKFTNSRWQKIFPLTTWLDEVDYFISVPKFKTHNLTVLTGAIKNIYGLIPGVYKLELHRRYYKPEDFASMLIDLYQITPPTLTIVDGIFALEGEGPASKGKIRKLGMLCAGTDCVAIDSILAEIMGIKPQDILTTKEAARRNLGKTRVEDMRILGEKLDTFKAKPFEVPATFFRNTHFQVLLTKLFVTLVRFLPQIDAKICNRCGACIKVCPQNVMSERGQKVVINYFGCIACFCCQEICPNAAIGIKKSLVARILKL